MTNKWIKGSVIAVVLLLVIVAVYQVGKMNASSSPSDERAVDSAPVTQTWTCSMHPQIKLLAAGPCPLCGMDLIPLSTDSSSDSESNAAMLTLSENAKALMEVEVVPVQRKFVTADVRMTGKIDYDETKLSNITAWIPGRLDKLYVDYTGVPVTKGDHLVYMYSPELISAQEEFLGAMEAVKNTAPGDSKNVQDMTQTMADAAREKLILLGLTTEQLNQIETEGKVSDHLTIYSPVSGIVIQKDAVEGMYVQTGTKIYTVADMSKVWARLDAYESDMEWIRYGQKVTFTTVSYPGQVFEGVISFIDPILNEKTRTVKLRLDIDNSEGKLKPGMFVKAIVASDIAAGGRVMDADMAGKWICPMHPGVVRETTDDCDICGMPLVTTESLGYVSDDADSIEKPLVIPVSAALITGERAIVYVQTPDDGEGNSVFEGREIVLGARAGDYYIVKSGLDESELVVVKGNFKIDSSLQIKAAGGMMSPEQRQEMMKTHKCMAEKIADEKPLTNDMKVGSEFQRSFAKFTDDYFKLQDSLAADSFDMAVVAVKDALADIQKIDMHSLEGEHHKKWMEIAPPLTKALKQTAEAKDIEQLRKEFYKISQQLDALIKYFGPAGKKPIYRMYCPMAFGDTGADWLQNHNKLLNPYFGSMMLRCGVMKEKIEVKDIWKEENE